MIQENVFLLLGSNLGDRLVCLRYGIAEIERHLGLVVRRSQIYETAPWGKTDQPNYLNQAVQIETQLSSSDLLNKMLDIEKSLGRTREEKWAARTLDIDLIYFGNQIIQTPHLIVPHPRIAERRFVLTPLAEISSDFIHPVLKKTNTTLLKECSDGSSVKIFTS